MIRAKQATSIALVILITLGLVSTLAAPVLAQEEDDNETGDQEEAEENGGLENKIIDEGEENEISEVEEASEGTEEIEEGPENEIEIPNEEAVEENKVEEEKEVEEEEEEEFENEEREIEVEETGEDELEIEAHNPDEENLEKDEDVSRLRIKTDEGASFEMEYEDLMKKSENKEGQEVELEFEAEFDRIVEFVDNNGNGIYDSGEEVSEYELGGENPISVQHKTDNKQGIITHIVTISTDDNVFTATLFQSGHPIIVSGNNVTPNEAKITIEIEDFPYKSSNSKLALRTNIESEMEIEVQKQEAKDSEEGVEVTSGSYGGFFTWKNTATVDGQRKPVKSTDISSEQGERKLYLVYGHGDSITHDPKIGVQGAVPGVTETVGAINWMTVIAAAIVAALVSAGVTGLVLRKKARPTR